MDEQSLSSKRLEGFMTILRMNFAEFLNTYLKEKGKKRRDLYRFVQLHGLEYDFTTMDKYFNSNPKVNRIPRGKKGKQFIELFALFLDWMQYK